MLDDETGDYLTSKLVDWEEGEVDYVIHARDDRPVFGARVRREGINEPGARGAALVRFRLQEAWVPTGKAERPDYVLGKHERLGQLSAFLREGLKAGGPKDPDPAFEFVDERHGGERA